MTNHSLVPPTKGSSGVLIGVVVLMLGGIAGMLYYKFSGASEQTASAETTAADVPEVKPAARPNMAPPPPPPPPEEEMPEVKEEEPDKKATAPKGNPNCPSTCTGTEPAGFKSALRGAAGRARGCYNKALETNVGLQGKVTVNVKVGLNGGACSATASNNTLGDSTVTSCILRSFRAASYPKPQGGCISGAVPLNFVAKQ